LFARKMKEIPAGFNQMPEQPVKDMAGATETG
jgi:hypothetical protein